MAKYKISKDYIKKLDEEKKREQGSSIRIGNKAVKTRREAEIGESRVSRVQQHCLSCGSIQTFRVDDLGWKYCMKCHAQAPDRSMVPG